MQNFGNKRGWDYREFAMTLSLRLSIPEKHIHAERQGTLLHRSTERKKFVSKMHKPLMPYIIRNRRCLEQRVSLRVTHMTGFSESRIVAALAKATTDRIVRKVIAQLQRQTEGRQSGDDSGLANVWDEVCVQLQFQESIFWDVYVETVKQFLAGPVDDLADYELAAVWLQTPQGEDWLGEEDGSRDADPVYWGDVVDYLFEMLCEKAANWSNPRIRTYLDRY